MSESKHIVVIGAGVTGLTCAYLLAQSGYRVTVVAAHLPGDKSIEYTSPWAGAHWSTLATADQPILCNWDAQTYEYWVEMMKGDGPNATHPTSGIKMFESFDYWDGDDTGEIWWAPHVQDFKLLHASDPAVEGINERSRAVGGPDVQTAVYYKTICIDVDQYLANTRKLAEGRGVKVIRAKLPTDSSFDEALAAAEQIAAQNGRVDGFVNACGLGGFKLCNDNQVLPIRGQTVLVKGEASMTTSRHSDVLKGYAIPRPGSGTTILGGTQDRGQWDGTPDPQTTQRILHNCSVLVPELLTGKDGGFEVISTQCGLRPGRNGGPRVERETVQGRKVVHAYGHAGAGYQNSIGCARLVLKLIEESLAAPAAKM